MGTGGFLNKTVFPLSNCQVQHNSTVIGCVGKSSCVLRYVEDKFNSAHLSTLQVGTHSSYQPTLEVSWQLLGCSYSFHIFRQLS